MKSLKSPKNLKNELEVFDSFPPTNITITFSFKFKSFCIRTSANMVKRRGKKPPSSSSAAALSANLSNIVSNNNNNNDEQLNRINAVMNNKQKTWLERLNSNDPHLREDGCDDITTMVSSSSFVQQHQSGINQLLHSLFQSGVLINLVRIILTDPEFSVRISATSALQNIAAVGGDEAVRAIVSLNVPAPSSNQDQQQPQQQEQQNQSQSTSFISALLDLLGDTFQGLENSIDHLKRYAVYQHRKSTCSDPRQDIPESEMVTHPCIHPDTPSKLLTELLSLCSVLAGGADTNANNNNNISVSLQLGRSTQLLTALIRTTIDSGFGADEVRSSLVKYYPVSSQESLACSCSELLYVLANQLASSTSASSSPKKGNNNSNPIADFLSNSVPDQYRVKIDSLIGLSSDDVQQLISKSPSRLCVALFLAGTFIHCFPSQSLRVVPLLAFCIKGESVIKVTSDAIPLLSASAVNENHHRTQQLRREKQEQQEQQSSGGQNNHNNNAADDDDEDDLIDDRETQLRQGPFRSLKVFHTAFTIANDVLNYVAEGDLPDVVYSDEQNDNNNNNNNGNDDEIFEEGSVIGDEEDEMLKFVNCGAYDAFQSSGLVGACLMRCGEIVSLPSDVVLRSALFDPSTNGHVMNLQCNFHSTVTSILRFNAMLLILLPFDEEMVNNNNNNIEKLRSFLSRVPIMWSSAFEGVKDRINALNYTKTQVENNNNSEDCASNLWTGISDNLYLQIENLIRMLFFIQKKTNNGNVNVTVTPEPLQVDLLRTLFFDQRYSAITSETRVDITGLMGQIALSAAKHNQPEALESCTKFLVETLNTAVSRCNDNNNNGSNNNSNNNDQQDEAIDVAAEAADLLMDVFNDERFDANVYRPQRVQSALQQFHPLLRPFASTKGLRRKSPRFQELNGVFRNLSGFLEYKVQNGN